VLQSSIVSASNDVGFDIFEVHFDVAYIEFLYTRDRRLQKRFDGSFFLRVDVYSCFRFA
jgi:hypothetical protein